jgi:hypothetical protein
VVARWAKDLWNQAADPSDFIAPIGAARIVGKAGIAGIKVVRPPIQKLTKGEIAALRSQIAKLRTYLKKPPIAGLVESESQWFKDFYRLQELIEKLNLGGGGAPK